MKLGVMGATGRVGRRVVEMARARGDTVVAVARQPDDGQRAGDATRPEDWRVLLADVDAVVSCVGGRDNLEPAAAALAEVGAGARVVWIGTLGCMALPDGGYRGDAAMPEALRPGWIAHRAAVERLRASDVAWTVLCPGHMPEGDAAPFRSFDVASLASPGPISTGSVAAAALRVVLDPATVGLRLGLTAIG